MKVLFIIFVIISLPIIKHPMELQAAFTTVNIQDHPFVFIGCCFAFLLFLAYLCIRETAPRHAGDEILLDEHENEIGG